MENAIYHKVVKHKKLQRLSKNLAVILPKAWLETLDWSQESNLIVAYHPDEHRIIITEDKNKLEVNNESTSDTITVSD